MKRALVVAGYDDDLGRAETGAVAEGLKNRSPGLALQIRLYPRPDLGPAEAGVLASPLETALTEGEANLAASGVHEMGLVLAEGVELAAVTQRQEARDAAVTADGIPLRAHRGDFEVLVDLPRRARVLKKLCPGLLVREVGLSACGMLEAVTEGGARGAVLALSDLRWLGKEQTASEIFRTSDLLPSPGQGAIGICVREGDARSGGFALSVHHKQTWMCVKAERALARTFSSTLVSPLGVLAQLGPDGLVKIKAVIFAPDGEVAAQTAGSARPEDAANLAERLGVGLRTAWNLSAEK